MAVRSTNSRRQLNTSQATSLPNIPPKLVCHCHGDRPAVCGCACRGQGWEILGQHVLEVVSCCKREVLVKHRGRASWVPFTSSESGKAGPRLAFVKAVKVASAEQTTSKRSKHPPSGGDIASLIHAMPMASAKGSPALRVHSHAGAGWRC